MISLLTSAKAGADSGFSNATTPAINTTGATLLVAVVTGFNTNAGILTDSAGNTWTALAAAQNASLLTCRLYYCASPTTSASHTFTASQGYSYLALSVYAFSGTDPTPLDVSNGQAHEGVDLTSYDTGSVTPSQADSLIVAGIALNSAIPVPTVNSGFTVTGLSSGHPDYFHKTIASAYLTQGAPAAVNPTFSWTGLSDAAAKIAVFKPLVVPDPPVVGTLSLTSASVGSVVLGLATNTGGTPPYSNQLQRSNYGAGSWSNIGSPVVGATATLTDATASASGHYDYRVVVTDDAEETGTTNTVEATVPSVVVPGTLTAGASFANVALSLTGTTGGTPPYSNQLQRSAAGAGSWSDVGSPVVGANPDFNDQSAVTATAYDYRVAVSDSETSPQTVNSGTATVTPGSSGGSGNHSPIGSTIIKGMPL